MWHGLACAHACVMDGRAQAINKRSSRNTFFRALGTHRLGMRWQIFKSDIEISLGLRHRFKSCTNFFSTCRYLWNRKVSYWIKSSTPSRNR
mmetsp:Transcript_19046/g.48969  ORF Transcript_19046/g.48969 Transcript_19046/m.48969 type:complete len:91 (+) Transcript_19046:587-859(+)